MNDTWRNERQVAREQVVAALQAGQSWQTVSQKPDVPVKRAMAYRLLRAVRERGKSALQDGRHGHSSKLRGEARAFLEACCREASSTPSSTLKLALHERFGLHVSVSQINRVRAALGVSNHPGRSPHEKKRKHSLVFRHRQNG
jgi:transposase